MIRRTKRYYNTNQFDLFEWEPHPNRPLNYTAKFIQYNHKVTPRRARLISELAFGGVQS
jgi:hypothetical protein